MTLAIPPQPAAAAPASMRPSVPPRSADGKDFVPGSCGWTVHDLDEVAIESEWITARYELIEGVVTKMAPALFSGGGPLFEIMALIRSSPMGSRAMGRFGVEIDIVIDDSRVVKADSAWMTFADSDRQHIAARDELKKDGPRARVLVPPTLVIESISPGHERHDVVTKRRWYAEFGVPNYWLLDGYARTLECLVLDGSDYRTDTAGRDQDVVRPALFTPLEISLGPLWVE